MHAIELARQANEDLRRNKDQELANKDAQIADLKQKMEDMAIEFGDMLKETLVSYDARRNSSRTNTRQTVQGEWTRRCICTMRKTEFSQPRAKTDVCVRKWNVYLCRTTFTFSGSS